MHRFSWKWQFVSNKGKGRISKRVFQENKARQIFRKTNIFTPWYAHVSTCANQGVKRTFCRPWYAHVRTCANQGVKNFLFSENLACLVFLKHAFWDCLITDELCQQLVLQEPVSWFTVKLCWFLCVSYSCVFCTFRILAFSGLR